MKWIPFNRRPMDDEEKERYPEWEYILDGPLPEDGERILVSLKYNNHEPVQCDEFYTDCEGCYLDSGYEIGTEALAWAPMPKPYIENSVSVNSVSVNYLSVNELDDLYDDVLSASFETLDDGDPDHIWDLPFPCVKLDDALALIEALINKISRENDETD